MNKNLKVGMLTCVILIIIILVGIAVSLKKTELVKSTPVETDQSANDSSIKDDKIQTNTVPNPKVLSQEQVAIDAWIKKNSFNQYGDPINTAYTGGTPLFNEQTGQSTDIYDYIVLKHPDRPWNITTTSNTNSNTSTKNTNTSTTIIPFTSIKTWDIYTDVDFEITYPKPDSLDLTIAKDNGYPVKIYNEKGFEFVIHKNAKNSNTNLICHETKNITENASLFLCHNKSEQYSQIYKRMLDSLVIK